MTESVDIELALRRHAETIFAVELRISNLQNELDVRLPSSDDPALVTFDKPTILDLEDLKQSQSPEAYGSRLWQILFGDERLRQGLENARKYAAGNSQQGTGERPLRVRLFIDPSAPDLHSIWWETLCDAT